MLRVFVGRSVDEVFLRSELKYDQLNHTVSDVTGSEAVFSLASEAISCSVWALCRNLVVANSVERT